MRDMQFLQEYLQYRWSVLQYMLGLVLEAGNQGLSHSHLQRVYYLEHYL
jgi:hypothetical protein